MHRHLYTIMNKNLILLGLLLSNFTVFSQVQTVGPFFPACDYGEIQTAISSGATEIRVVDGNYLENLSFQTSLTIKGGYATCADAENNNQGLSQATIDGSNQDFPVISMINSNSRSTVILENLILTNGNAATTSGGGLLLSNMDIDLSLNNVKINNNHSDLLGGGIAVNSNSSISTDISMLNTTVTNNTAPRGGGIYCNITNGSASISLRQASGISSNSATSSSIGMGGGVYLKNCTLNVYSGTDQTNSDIGISSNTAVKEGGGIYASSGAFISLYGHANCSGGNCVGDDDINPVNLSGNTASSGGALYLSGVNTYAEIFAGLINNNHSSLNGGAISILDNAILDIRRITKECWNPVRCNLFISNTAAFNGGAIYSESPNVAINNTYFEDNRANLGTAIYSAGTAITKIDSSVFNNNGDSGNGSFNDKYVIRNFNGALVEIVQSTFADNNATTAVLGISSTSELKLYSSIVHDASSSLVLDVNSPGTTIVDCIMAHEVDSLPNKNRFHTQDPQFINRNNRDYHLNPLIPSRAIDFCSAPPLAFSAKDIDQEDRNWDFSVGDLYGAYDLGADEYNDTDFIFMNGFE